jgi:hypothetical protein
MGQPMPRGRITSNHYSKMEAQTMGRLSGWKLHTLSHAGHLALAKYILHALLVYYMGEHLLPKILINRLVASIQRFFWGKTQQSHYLAYVSWDCISLPIERGRLGLRRLDILNMTVILKVLWVLCTNQQSIWANMCKAKYKGMHT